MRRTGGEGLDSFGRYRQSLEDLLPSYRESLRAVRRLLAMYERSYRANVRETWRQMVLFLCVFRSQRWPPDEVLATLREILTPIRDDQHSRRLLREMEAELRVIIGWLELGWLAPEREPAPWRAAREQSQVTYIPGDEPDWAEPSPVERQVRWVQIQHEAGLTPEEAVAVWLVWGQKLSIRKAALKADLPKSTLEDRYRAGKSKLGRYLAAWDVLAPMREVTAVVKMCPDCGQQLDLAPGHWRGRVSGKGLEPYEFEVVGVPTGACHCEGRLWMARAHKEAIVRAITTHPGRQRFEFSEVLPSGTQP